MPKRFAIAATATLVALLFTAVDVTAVGADENALAACLRGKEDQIDVRMKACEGAAKLGYPKAILLIGMAHVYGKGATKDYVKAYMYFKVLHHISDTLEPRYQAETRKYSDDLIADLTDRMTSADVSRAEALARVWISDNLNKAREKR